MWWIRLTTMVLIFFGMFVSFLFWKVKEDHYEGIRRTTFILSLAYSLCAVVLVMTMFFRSIWFVLTILLMDFNTISFLIIIKNLILVVILIWLVITEIYICLYVALVSSEKNKERAKDVFYPMAMTHLNCLKIKEKRWYGILSGTVLFLTVLLIANVCLF